MTEAFHFEAKKYALRQAKDGVIVSFVVHPNDVVPELLSAAIGEHYVVALAPYTEQGPPSSTGSEQPNSTRPVGGSNPSADATDKERRPFASLPRSQQAALLIADEKFRRWWDRGNDADAVDRSLKAAFGIASKRDLNAPERAREWDEFVGHYRQDTGQSTWERPQ